MNDGGRDHEDLVPASLGRGARMSMLSGTQNGAEIETPPKLSPYAQERLRMGLHCYLRPDDRDGFLAVCLDLGAHARGATPEEARNELNLVISDTIIVASEHGGLDEMLKREPSRALQSDYQAVKTVLFVLHVLRKASALTTVLKTFAREFAKDADQWDTKPADFGFCVA